MSLIVCCMLFHREQTSEEGDHLLILTPATRHCGMTFTNLQCGTSPSASLLISTVCLHQVHHCQSRVWHLTKCTIANLQCVPHQVRHSLITTVCLLQEHRSLISTVHLIKCDVHWSPLCASYNCTVRNSPVLRLYKGCTNLHCCVLNLLPFHPSTVNLHLLATILCDYATRRLCDYVIMLFVHSTLSTILLPMWIRLVDYLTAS